MPQSLPQSRLQNVPYPGQVVPQGGQPGAQPGAAPQAPAAPAAVAPAAAGQTGGMPAQAGGNSSTGVGPVVPPGAALAPLPMPTAPTAAPTGRN